MKNLRKFLVFVLFALATVFAFGLNSVKAANGDTYTITFNDKAKRTTYSTTQQIWTENGIVVTNNKASSTTNVGDYYNPARFYKGSELIVEFTTTVSSIEFDCNTSSYATSLKKNSVSGIGAWSGSSDKVVLTLTTPSTKVTISMTDGQVRMDKITVTEYQELAGVTILDAPENVVLNGNTLTWDEVENAGSYSVYLGNNVVCEDAESPLDLTTLDLSDVAYDKYTVSVVAVAADETYADSVKGAATAEFVHAPVYANDTKYAYLTYKELAALAPADKTESKEQYVTRVYVLSVSSTTYGNLNVIDENGDKFLIYGLYSFDGSKRYDAMATADKPVAGDEIVVKGIIQNYLGTTFEVKNAKLIQLNDKSYETACQVGFQTAEAEEGQHVRIIAGLNVDYNELEALSFTITDAEDNERVIEVEKVFGTLVANGEAGVVEVTAESQGFECLFAVTVTNVPAGTTLYVTATYKTATATYTTLVKAIVVE